MSIRHWEYTFGDKVIPIKANDVVETLNRVIPYMFFKLENDEKIKTNVQMKIIHEIDIQILEVMRGVFSDTIEEDRKAHPHMKTVPKKTAKEGT